jgi:hypothetical protein
MLTINPYLIMLKKYQKAQNHQINVPLNYHSEGRKIFIVKSFKLEASSFR